MERKWADFLMGLAVGMCIAMIGLVAAYGKDFNMWLFWSFMAVTVSCYLVAAYKYRRRFEEMSKKEKEG